MDINLTYKNLILLNKKELGFWKKKTPYPKVTLLGWRKMLMMTNFVAQQLLTNSNKFSAHWRIFTDWINLTSKHFQIISGVNAIAVFGCLSIEGSFAFFKFLCMSIKIEHISSSDNFGSQSVFRETCLKKWSCENEPYPGWQP